jgi:hypothetical protein
MSIPSQPKTSIGTHFIKTGNPSAAVGDESKVSLSRPPPIVDPYQWGPCNVNSDGEEEEDAYSYSSLEHRRLTWTWEEGR